METQQLVTIVPWTFIATILNLFLQLYLIKRFLFKPVQEVIRKRQEKADQNIRAAEKAREEAESVRSEYEKNMANARAEASSIIDRAKKDAESRSEQLLRAAEEQAKNLKTKADQDIRQERRKALNELKGEIGGIAMDIAGKVVEKEIDEKDHRSLIEDFLKNVEEAS